MGGIALGKAVLSSGLLDDLDAVLQSFVSGMGLWAILGVFSVVAMVISYVSHLQILSYLLPSADFAMKLSKEGKERWNADLSARLASFLDGEEHSSPTPLQPFFSSPSRRG
jgi:hypothetical protein